MASECKHCGTKLETPKYHNVEPWVEAAEDSVHPAHTDSRCRDLLSAQLATAKARIAHLDNYDVDGAEERGDKHGFERAIAEAADLVMRPIHWTPKPPGSMEFNAMVLGRASDAIRALKYRTEAARDVALARENAAEALKSAPDIGGDVTGGLGALAALPEHARAL